MARTHSSAFSLLSDFDRAGHKDTAPDHEAQVRAAFEDGHRQGQAEARAEADADAELRLAETRMLHAEELAAQKENIQRDVADLLMARLESMSGQIERSIEERVAALLRPWLLDRLRERALQDLERAISRALVEGAKVHIEAPAEILEHLRALPWDGFQIGYSESQSADVRAVMEDTCIEVNISAWIAELEAAAP